MSQTPEMHAYDLKRDLQLVPPSIEERVAEENLGFDVKLSPAPKLVLQASGRKPRMTIDSSTFEIASEGTISTKQIVPNLDKSQ